jgi:hypothetical protein
MRRYVQDCVQRDSVKFAQQIETVRRATGTMVDYQI